MPVRKIAFLASAALSLAVVVAGFLWNGYGGPRLRGSSEERPLEGLNEFGVIPEFSLIERDGRRITLADLKGRVSVVNFIYTNCPDTCPIQSAQIKEIQDGLKGEEDLRLVSITVDPERDTPAVLEKYASRFGADPARWLFLTGEKESIYRLAQKGFQLGAAEIPHEHRPASGTTHAHSPRFVLVDREAQIRGYYVSTETGAMKRLRRDVETLLHGRRRN